METDIDLYKTDIGNLKPILDTKNQAFDSGKPIRNSEIPSLDNAKLIVNNEQT